MGNFLLVTTFNQSGYDLYGKKMLESFLKHWPLDQKILVYTEEVNVDSKITQDARVEIHDLLKSKPLVDFKTRHADNPVANGIKPPATFKDFKYDAVRFSHKVFALYDAVLNNPTSSVIWLDADTITHSKIPQDFLTTNFPTNNYGVAYLGRTEQYTECGWVVYHMTNPMMKDFWETFANYYIQDTIFKLKEWHDSYVFDVVRKEYENKGMINHNITPGFTRGHPFINCVLGEYMDHMKGPRKKVGRSKKEERVLPGKNIDWWK